MTITGQQRAVLAKHWIKSDRDMTLEAYIRAVCKAKGMTYAPAPKLDKKFN